MPYASSRPLPLPLPMHARADPLPVLPPVMAAQEAERVRVARELHDELGQYLLALKLELSRLAQAGDADGAPVLQQGVRGLLPLVDGTMAAVRRIALDLRPPELSESGLVPALQALAQQVRARLSVTVEVRAYLQALGDTRMDPVVELASYRIAQEALSNAVRHAKASTVVVEVIFDGASFLLRVRDDGTGLSRYDATSRPRLGLQGMRERAEACGGQLQVQDALQGGCVIEARMPIAGAAGKMCRDPRFTGEVN
jgi:signal transduction histidine kinase